MPASSPYSGCGMTGNGLSRLVSAIPPSHAPTTIATRSPIATACPSRTACSAPHSGQALGGPPPPWAPPRSLGGHPAFRRSPLGLRSGRRPSRSPPAPPASHWSAPAPVLCGPRASWRAAARFLIRRLLPRRAYYLVSPTPSLPLPVPRGGFHHALWGRVVAAAPPNMLMGLGLSALPCVLYVLRRLVAPCGRAPYGRPPRRSRAAPRRGRAGFPRPLRSHPWLRHPAKGLAGFGR